MLNSLKSFFALNKKEVRRNSGSAFIVPVIKFIQKDISELEKSFQHLEHLVDSGFKIGFDKIPAEVLTDLIEQITEFSAIVEASDISNKLKLTELSAQMHNNAGNCSSMSAFLVNSVNPEQDIENILVSFENIKNELAEVCQLI